MHLRTINTLIPLNSKPVLNHIVLLLISILCYLTIRFMPIDFIPLLAILFGIISLLFFSTLSPSNIIKTIFWITFLNMFIDTALIRHYVFDLNDAGYATRINWFADALLFMLVFRLIGAKKNRKYFRKLNLFTVIFTVIIISTLINMQSIIYSFLSLRVLYTFLLLAYVIYIYDFTKNEYESYFKLFFVLAILNSALSIIQFSLAGQLGFSNQLAGGIFGYHGTGISAIFSVVQSALCIQIFLKKRKIIYFFLSIFIAIPIVTGYAYGGFVFMGMAIIILSFSYIRKISIIKIIKVSIVSITIFFSIFTIAQKIQSQSAFKSYYQIYTNFNLFRGLLVDNTTGGDFINISRNLGRIGSVIFAIQSITENPLAFWVGYGPGAISYRGYTTKVSASFLDKNRVKGAVTLLQAYIYEVGIWGPLFLITIFYLLYRKWKKTRRPNFGMSQYYFNNIGILLPVFLLSTVYTHALGNSFLVIFFAINLSYMNHCYKTQKSSNTLNNLNFISK